MEEQPTLMVRYGNGPHGPIGIVTSMGKIIMDSDLSRTATPVARKRYRCCECKKSIQKGERYQLIEGLWDGNVWDRFKTCLDCVDMRECAVRHYRHGIHLGHLHEYLAAEVESVLDDPGGVP